jgi:ribosomal protein S18 acetylase RimI-like enzyme
VSDAAGSTAGRDRGLGRRAQRAHGDAWEQLGRVHAGGGGGTRRLPGIRLMASGLPHTRWNNADVDDPALVDIATVVSWYADRGVPWGVSVPAGASWPHGRLLFRQRLMALPAGALAPAAPPAGVDVRTAGRADLDGVVVVDAEAFDAPPEDERPWLEPLLSADDAVVAVAYDGDRAVGCGYAIVTEGDAGRTVYVAGIGVLEASRRRGIGAAVSSWLVEHGFARGADLAHLNPDTDVAASVYRRLGFGEVPGFDIYVDVTIRGGSGTLERA